MTDSNGLPMAMRYVISFVSGLIGTYFSLILLYDIGLLDELVSSLSPVFYDDTKFLEVVMTIISIGLSFLLISAISLTILQRPGLALLTRRTARITTSSILLGIFMLSIGFAARWLGGDTDSAIGIFIAALVVLYVMFGVSLAIRANRHARRRPA